MDIKTIPNIDAYIVHDIAYPWRDKLSMHVYAVAHRENIPCLHQAIHDFGLIPINNEIQLYVKPSEGVTTLFFLLDSNSFIPYTNEYIRYENGEPVTKHQASPQPLEFAGATLAIKGAIKLYAFPLALIVNELSKTGYLFSAQDERTIAEIYKQISTVDHNNHMGTLSNKNQVEITSTNFWENVSPLLK